MARLRAFLQGYGDDALLVAGGVTIAVGVALFDVRVGIILLGVELAALGYVVRSS